MFDVTKIDHSAWDRPEIISAVFHPRPDPAPETPAGAQDLFIEAENRTSLMARVHQAASDAPNILFFHGNGEIVADYDQLGSVYTDLGLTFIPVDYRGYGQSNGSPSITAMLRDAHLVLDFVQNWLLEQGRNGPLLVMGRSLGSAPALELACTRQHEFQALIIESGFAYALPLLRLLGVEVQGLGLEESQGFNNVHKMAQVQLPTLVIHAQWDHIISLAEGQTLYEVCTAQDKEFLEIPGANHNDIFLRDLQRYMATIKKLADRLL